MVRIRSSKGSPSTSTDPSPTNSRNDVDEVPALESNIETCVSEIQKLQSSRDWKILVGIFGLAVFIRVVIGMGPYSGYGVPPMHGDYEAQRHWLEITHHLPITQWYFYDLQYWGLDYPPLTAFHSQLLGYVAHSLNPSWVELDSSRGLESPESKLFMRLTVLLSDLLIFFSGAVYFCQSTRPSIFNTRKLAGLVLLLLNPCFTLIDHGHFQYNCVMLGLALWSFGLLKSNHHLLGAFAFCIALGFKQMALFYALPVFFYLLQKIALRGVLRGTILLIKVGITTVLSFYILLMPFILAGHDELGDYGRRQLMQIFDRVFPVGRGLYEDKVANFWCALNVGWKLRSLYPIPVLARISAGVTLMALLPSCLHLFKSRTSPGFIYSLTISALTFFLFGFQVHEKTILLPMLPLALLFVDGHEGIWLVRWFTNIAAFSMYPLLKKEGLAFTYWSNIALWNLVTRSPSLMPSSFLGWMELMSTCGAIVLPILSDYLAPPPQYPDIHIVANILYATPHFLAALLYLNWRQFFPTDRSQGHIKRS